jgi:hypothetical protein
MAGLSISIALGAVAISTRTFARKEWRRMVGTLELAEVGEGERGVPPIEIYLDPVKLHNAAEAGFAREAPGADFEKDLPRGYIVFREFSPPLELRGLDYWLHFDETFQVSHGARQYLVKVPSFADVYRQFDDIYLPPAQKFNANYRRFLERQFEYLDMPEGTDRLQQFLLRYHELMPPDQAEGIRLVREAFARAKLTNSIGQLTMAYLSALSKAKPQDREFERWQGEIKAYAKFMEAFAIDEPLYAELFVKYYWEGAAIPVPEHPGIIRYLPPSPGERHEGENWTPVDPPIDPPEDDAAVVIPPAEAGKRFQFYQRVFGCKVVVRPRKLFGKEEHNYFGYLVKTRKGNWLLIVDCDKAGCAAYIFQIDPNDPLRYIQDVQLPRQELRNIKAARCEANPPEDRAPSYVGREFHDETIESRMERRWKED